MRKSIFILMAAVGLTAVACTARDVEIRTSNSAPQLTGSAFELLEQAKKQFHLGNIALASEGFRKAIRAQPDRPEAYNGLAACYDRMGRFDLSRRYYEEALALAPNDPKVRHNFALSLRLQGKSREAAALEAEGLTAPERLAAVEETIGLPAPAMAALTAEGAAAAPVVRIALPPAPTTASPSPPAASRRLERMSLGEVALITTSAPPHPETTVRRVEAKLVRSTGKELAFRFDASVKSVKAAVPARPMLSLRVMNAVGRKGHAGRLKSYLTANGWRSIAVGDAAEKRAISTILYPTGQESAAARLSKQLPFKTRTAASPVATRLVLLAGQNSVAFDERLLRRSKV